MTKTARSLKIFDMPLGDGGKPGHLYDQQQLKKQLQKLFQGPRGLKITFKHPNPYPKDWLPGPDGKRPIDKA